MAAALFLVREPLASYFNRELIKTSANLRIVHFLDALRNWPALVYFLVALIRIVILNSILNDLRPVHNTTLVPASRAYTFFYAMQATLE